MKINLKLLVGVCFTLLALFGNTRHTTNNYGILDNNLHAVWAQLGTTDTVANPAGGGTGGFDYAIDRSMCLIIVGFFPTSIITELFGPLKVVEGYVDISAATCLYRLKREGETGCQLGDNVTCAMVFERLFAALDDY